MLQLRREREKTGGTQFLRAENTGYEIWSNFLNNSGKYGENKEELSIQGDVSTWANSKRLVRNNKPGS